MKFFSRLFHPITRIAITPPPAPEEIRESALQGTEIRAEWSAGQPAARLHFHDSPWREPALLRFEIDATVLCKRVPAPCERGDCLYQLGTDWVPD